MSSFVRDALAAVHEMPRSEAQRAAWLAVNALAPHADRRGVATVGLERLAAESGFTVRRLRDGIRILAALDVLDLDPLVKKPGSDEWQARTYRFRAGT